MPTQPSKTFLPFNTPHTVAGFTATNENVTFREDHCLIRKGHADTNFSTVRRTALSVLKNEKIKKLGIKNQRLSAGWDEPYLFKVLFGT